MLLLIISILIPVISFVVMKKTDDCLDVFGYIIISIFIFLFLWIATYPIKLETKKETDSKKIVATKYDNKIEGTIEDGIFYHTCKIGEKEYYVYMTEVEDGVYRQDKVPVENTVLIETSVQPRIVKVNTYKSNMLPWKIRFDFNKKSNISESDTLFVPKGTISDKTIFEIF